MYIDDITGSYTFSHKDYEIYRTTTPPNTHDMLHNLTTVFTMSSRVCNIVCFALQVCFRIEENPGFVLAMVKYPFPSFSSSLPSLSFVASLLAPPSRSVQISPDSILAAVSAESVPLSSELS